MPPEKKPLTGNALLDQLANVPQTGGSALAPAAIPALDESKVRLVTGTTTAPIGTYSQRSAQDVLRDLQADQLRQQAATQKRLAKQKRDAEMEAERLAPLDAQAWTDARAANPSATDEQLRGWKDARLQMLIGQVDDQKQKDIDGYTDQHFLSLIGAGDVEAMLGERRNSMLQNAAANISDPNSKLRDPAYLAKQAIKPGSLALQILPGLLTGKTGMNTDFLQNEDGSISPEFKRQVYELAGGDPNYFKSAAAAIVAGKVDEYDQAPSAAANIVNSALDYMHKPNYANQVLFPMAEGLKRTGYYTTSGATSGIKAAAKTGLFMGHLLKPNSDEQYRSAVEATNQFSDRAATEAHPDFNTLRNDPIAFFDAAAGEASRLTGQVLGLGKVAGRGNAVSGAFERGALNAELAAAVRGEGSILANTAGNKMFTGLANTINAIDKTRLPVYLDNVVSTGRMFYAPMYHDYYTDALAKGYSTQDAQNKASQRATVSIMAMALANWAGPRAKDAINKLPKDILQGVDRELATTFRGQAGRFTREAINRFNPKGAAFGGIGMGTSALADAYQEHLDEIERGVIEPGTPFDAKKAIAHAAEGGMVGFLTMGMSHLAGSHGAVPETPQASAMYQALANRPAFSEALSRQVRKRNITEQQATSLNGMLDMVAPEVSKYSADIKSGKITPEMAVKLGIEEARKKETADAIQKLAAQTTPINTYGPNGEKTTITYGLDPATGEYTREYGAKLDAQIKALQGKADASTNAIQQLKDGSYIRGRVVSGDEMLRITANATQEGRLTTEQANRIIAEGPYSAQEVDITQYANDPEVKGYLDQLENGENIITPKPGHDPILGSDGTIIDGKKRIAWALNHGVESMMVVRPRTTEEAAKSAQEEHDATLGSDIPDLQGAANPEVITAAREAYDAGYEREATDADAKAGLNTEASRAIVDAAKVIAEAGLPKAEAIEALQRATGHNLTPADAEHFFNVATGTKPAESVFKPAEEVAPEVVSPEVAAPEVSPEVQEQALTRLLELQPVITESPLWDKVNNKPLEGVTIEDLREYAITEEVPDHLKRYEEVQPEQAVAEEVTPEVAPVEEAKPIEPVIEQAPVVEPVAEAPKPRIAPEAVVPLAGGEKSRPAVMMNEDGTVNKFSVDNWFSSAPRLINVSPENIQRSIDHLAHLNDTLRDVDLQASIDYLRQAAEMVNGMVSRQGDALKDWVENGKKKFGGYHQMATPERLKLLDEYKRQWQLSSKSTEAQMLFAKQYNGILKEVHNRFSKQGLKPHRLAELPAAEMAEAKTTVDHTTKNGSRVYVDENGSLRVVDKNGKPVSETTARKLTLEAAAAHDFTAGKTTDETVGYPEDHNMNDRELTVYQAENSSNPSELAQIWLDAPREGPPMTGAMWAIKEQGGFQTNSGSFKRFHDENAITNGIARAYFRDGKTGERKAPGLDQVADEITSTTGVEVKVEDLVDYILAFPTGTYKAEQTFLSPGAEKAAERFKELTGFPLTEGVPLSTKIAEIAHQQSVDKLNAAEKALHDEFIANEYDTREQEERDFEQAVKDGRIDPYAEVGNIHEVAVDGEGKEAQGAVEDIAGGEGRIEAAQGANEQPVEAGERPPTLVQRKGNVDYHVTFEPINKAGWSKQGIEAFAQKLNATFSGNVRVAIHNEAQARELNNGLNPEAWTENGVLHLNIEHPSLKPSALLEEASHLWIEVVRKVAPEIHDKGIELARDTDMYRHMEALHNGETPPESKLSKDEKADAAQYAEAYKNHSDPLYSFANEVLAKGIRTEGKEFSAEPDKRKNFGAWLQSFWNAAKKSMGFDQFTAKTFATLKFKEFAKAAAHEIGSGKALTTRIKAEGEKIEAVKKKAVAQEKKQEKLVDQGQAAIAGKKKAAPAGVSVIDTGVKGEAEANDRVFTAIGKAGGGELSAIFKNKAPEQHAAAVTALEPIAGSRDAAEDLLAETLSNPEAASQEVKDVLGVQYAKKKGQVFEDLVPGHAYNAMAAVNEVINAGYKPGQLSKGLAKYAEAQAAQEAKQKQNVKKGTANQAAGAAKNRAANEKAFVDELAQAIADQKIGSGKDIDALVAKHGVDPARVKDLTKVATNKVLGEEFAEPQEAAPAEGEKMFALGDNKSPRDERQSFIDLLKEAADKDAEKFHEEALPLIKSAYKTGIIDKEAAIELHRQVEEAARNDQKVYEFLDNAEKQLLPDEAPQAGQSASEPPTGGTKPPPNTAQTGNATSIRNEAVDAERQALGMPERMLPAKKTFGDAWDNAMRTMERDPAAGANLVNELRQKVRPLTAEEDALLTHRQITMQTVRRQVIAELNTAAQTGDAITKAALEQRLSEVSRELQDIYDLGQAAGTENARGLAFRRMVVRDDYSLEAMKSRERANNGGKQLSKEAEAKIEELHKRLEEADEKIAKLEADAVKKTVEQVKKTVEKPSVISKLFGTGKAKAVSGSNMIMSAVERMKARRGTAKKNDGQAMFSLAPEARENPLTSEDRSDIVEIVRGLVVDGHTDVNEIMQLAHEYIVDAVPDATLRDVGEAFSEYGKVKLPSKDELSLELSRLREEERLTLALEDAESGVAPKKTGFQRQKMSDYARELKRKVKAMIDEKGLQGDDPEARLASSLDAVKNRLRNQIADLNKQLITGEKTAKRQGVAYDAEALALRAQRDALRSQLEALEGKREMSDAQRIKIATAAMEHSIKEYDRQLEEFKTTGKITKPDRTSKTPNTPELEALRAERQQRIDELKELQEAANPKKTKEEIALERIKTNMRKRIAELEERMRTGNYDKTPRNKIELDSEALTLSREKQKIIDEYEIRQEKHRLKNRTRGEWLKDTALEAWNAPKGLVSSLDMSAPLRQGAILGAGNPKEFAGAFGEMFHQAFNKERSEKWLHAVHESDSFPLMKQSGLYLNEPNAKLLAREEVFASKIPEKIPLYGKLYKASERAYAGFLNRLRVDVFMKGVDQLKQAGITPETDPQAFKDLAEFVNNATGRGNLGGLERASGILNGLMFSPRMLASRFGVFKPIVYSRMNPEVRKIAAKNMLSFVAYGMSMMGLAAMAGAEVEEDPRSADFGKIKIGDTRYDIWGGYSQIARYTAQFLTGQRKSTTSGDIVDLDGSFKAYGQNRMSVLGNFARSKASPAIGTSINLLTGENMVGEEARFLPWKDEAGKWHGGEAVGNISPLYIQDMTEIINDKSEGGGVIGAAEAAIPSFFGVGVQRYKPK